MRCQQLHAEGGCTYLERYGCTCTPDACSSPSPNTHHPLFCRGQQLFYYKRAQIFVGDVFGAFGGQGLGSFPDIGQLTTFAGGMSGLAGWLAVWQHATRTALCLQPRLPTPSNLQYCCTCTCYPLLHYLQTIECQLC